MDNFGNLSYFLTAAYKASNFNKLMKLEILK